MKNWRFGAALAAITVACTVAVGCGGGDKVSGPDTDFDTTPTASAPAANPSPAPAAEDGSGFEGCNAALRVDPTKAFKVNGSTLSLTVHNPLEKDCGPVSLGVYSIFDPNVDDKDGQKLVDQDNHANIKAGATITLEANLPECGPWQGDGYQALTMPQAPVFSPGYFLGAKRGDTGSCKPPETPGCGVRGVNLAWAVSQNEASAVSASVVSLPSLYGTFTLTWNGAAASSSVDPDIANASPLPYPTGSTSPATKNHSYDYLVNGGVVTALGTVVFKDGTKCSDDVTIEIPALTCDHFPKPSVNVSLGAPDTTLTATQLTVNGIPVTQDAGVSGSFTPTLPSGPHNRPLYPASAGSLNFDYNWTKSYNPVEGLECRTSGKVSKTVPIPPTEPTCEELNKPTHTASGTYANFTPASTVYRQYWRMNQGNDNARENACVNRGGVWLNDYNIPDDGTGSQRPDVCRFNFSSAPAGAPGADMSLYDPPGTVVINTPADGVKVTGTATFSNAGNWRVEIYATGQGGPWVKDFKEVTLQCGQSSTKNVSYSCENCHENSSFFVRVIRNGVQQDPSPYPLN